MSDLNERSGIPVNRMEIWQEGIERLGIQSLNFRPFCPLITLPFTLLPPTLPSFSLLFTFPVGSVFKAQRSRACSRFSSVLPHSRFTPPQILHPYFFPSLFLSLSSLPLSARSPLVHPLSLRLPRTASCPLLQLPVSISLSLPISYMQSIETKKESKKKKTLSGPLLSFLSFFQTSQVAIALAFPSHAYHLDANRFFTSSDPIQSPYIYFSSFFFFLLLVLSFIKFDQNVDPPYSRFSSSFPLRPKLRTHRDHSIYLSLCPYKARRIHLY